MIQFQTLFDDGDQHVSSDASPYFPLDCVFGCSKARLDTQMLFDPFDKQLDLSALFVMYANSQCGKCHVVGQKLQRLAGFGLDVGDLSNQLWNSMVRLVSHQLNMLLACQAGIDRGRKRLHHNELHIVFGAGYKALWRYAVDTV